MNTGQIKKGKTSGNFTVIPNHIFSDKNIKLKALGLLCFLLKLPPDWVLNKSSLYRQLNEGRDAVSGAFTELEKAGYITKQLVREKGRFLGYNYTVHEVSQLGLSATVTIEDPVKIAENPQTLTPETVQPITGNPLTVPPVTDNPALQNKVLTKTDNNKTSLLVTNVTNKGPVVSEVEKKKTFYQLFIEVYSVWHKQNEDTPAKIDGAQGNAAKALMGYFKTIVKERFKKDNAGAEIPADQLEPKTLEAWELVLNNWDLLEPFYQNKTRLIDINSNIQNIIKQIKDGSARKKGTANGQKIDAGGVKTMFDAIDSKYR